MKIPWLCAMLLAHPAALALAQQAVDPAQSKDDQPSAQVLRLEDVVREALDKNPEAQSALHSIKALERRVPQAAAMPDPTVSVGWAGNPAPFSIMAGDASSYRGVTLSEQFPYPGKLKLQGAIAGKDVTDVLTNGGKKGPHAAKFAGLTDDQIKTVAEYVKGLK